MGVTRRVAAGCLNSRRPQGSMASDDEVEKVQDEIDDLDLGMDKKKKKSKKPKDDDDDAPSKSGEIEHWRAASLGPAVRCSSQQTLCE